MPRKKKSQPRPEPTQAAPAAAVETAAPSAPKAVVEEAPVPSARFKSIALQFGMIAVAMFFAGYIIAVIGTFSMNYMDLPNAGSVQTDRMGNAYFQADYSFFNRFAERTETDPFGTEMSKFRQVGIIPTALYVYSITNALHWIMEWRVTNLQFLAFMPFFVIAAGASVFCLYVLPKPWRTQERILYSCIAIGTAHALLVIVATLLFGLFSGTFLSMYNHGYIMGGQLTGTMIPGFVIMILTNTIYASIASLFIYSYSAVASYTSR